MTIHNILRIQIKIKQALGSLRNLNPQHTFRAKVCVDVLTSFHGTLYLVLSSGFQFF